MAANIEYAEKIQEIESERGRLSQELTSLKSQWVEDKHPVKIGQVVDVNGWAYKGAKMVVHTRWVEKGWMNNQFVWKARGDVLKKDGTKGNRQGEWYQEFKAE